MQDTCLPDQVAMHQELSAAGRPVHVIISEVLCSAIYISDGYNFDECSSQHILDSPEPILRALCDALGIDFTPKMLSWSAGPKPIDGVWANHWYKSTHQSTG